MQNSNSASAGLMSPTFIIQNFCIPFSYAFDSS